MQPKLNKNGTIDMRYQPTCRECRRKKCLAEHDYCDSCEANFAREERKGPAGREMKVPLPETSQAMVWSIPREAGALPPTEAEREQAFFEQTILEYRTVYRAISQKASDAWDWLNREPSIESRAAFFDSVRMVARATQELRAIVPLERTPDFANEMRSVEEILTATMLAVPGGAEVLSEGLAR